MSTVDVAAASALICLWIRCYLFFLPLQNRFFHERFGNSPINWTNFETDRQDLRRTARMQRTQVLLGSGVWSICHNGLHVRVFGSVNYCLFPLPLFT